MPGQPSAALSWPCHHRHRETEKAVSSAVLTKKRVCSSHRHRRSHVFYSVHSAASMIQPQISRPTTRRVTVTELRTRRNQRRLPRPDGSGCAERRSACGERMEALSPEPEASFRTSTPEMNPRVGRGQTGGQLIGAGARERTRKSCCRLIFLAKKNYWMK